LNLYILLAQQFFHLFLSLVDVAELRVCPGVGAIEDYDPVSCVKDNSGFKDEPLKFPVAYSFGTDRYF
jgi:hypothetical protein